MWSSASDAERGGSQHRPRAALRADGRRRRVRPRRDRRPRADGTGPGRRTGRRTRADPGSRLRRLLARLGGPDGREIESVGGLAGLPHRDHVSAADARVPRATRRRGAGDRGHGSGGGDSSARRRGRRRGPRGQREHVASQRAAAHRDAARIPGRPRRRKPRHGRGPTRGGADRDARQRRGGARARST